MREREFGSPPDWLGNDGYPHRSKNYEDSSICDCWDASSNFKYDITGDYNKCLGWNSLKRNSKNMKILILANFLNLILFPLYLMSSGFRLVLAF